MEVQEAMKALRSVRKFKPLPIPEDKLKNVLNAARLAPSAENRQPWKFLVLRDDDAKKIVANGCNNKKFIIEAPIVLLGCALPDEAYPTLGGYMCSYPVDLGSALSNIALAAANEGLGTNLIFDFSEDRLRAALNIPSEYKVVAVTPLGFPAEEPTVIERKHLNEIVCYDNFK